MDRGIIMSAMMVQALIAGRKRQTRRLGTSPLRKHVRPGDRFWVRESFRADIAYERKKPRELPSNCAIKYAAGGIRGEGVWGKLRPAIFMPRHASRITMTVAAVRYEHVRMISAEDAIAEGLAFHAPDEEDDRAYYYLADHSGPQCPREDPRETYAALWRQLHKGEGERWEDNPYVVIFDFDEPEIT